MRFLSLRSAALVLGLAMALPATAGQLYKWTDANGRIQYSDTAPPDRKTEVLKRGSSTTTAPSESTAKAAPSSATDQEAAFRKRRTDAAENEDKLAKEAAEKKSAEENCNRARGYLASLERGRVASTNEKGDREYFDEAKLASEKERANKQIAQYCKS